jgi:ubiquinone/menaquinone biosynthesis C-methylase UbiE
MSTDLQFEGDAARQLEAAYMSRQIVAQRHKTLQTIGLRLGEHVLDIGAGPGFLASDMSEIVGPSGRVCGIDTSESMLTIARSRCAGRPVIEFEIGGATRIPYPDASFDVATSTQVYEYVQDMTAALAELYRVLRPLGRALILDTDWDSIVWHSSDSALANRVLLAWDEHLVDPHLPRTLRPALRSAGFQVESADVFTIFQTEFTGFSEGVSGLIAAFVVGRRGVTSEEVAVWLEDLRTLDEAGAYFFSITRYLFLAVKPGGPLCP